MNNIDFFTLLYPFVPLTGLIGYIPQLVKLSQLQQPPKSVSMLTWYIWLATWIVSLGYTYFVVNDMLLCLTATINTVAHTAIIIVTHYKAAKYSYCGVTLENGGR